MYNTAPGSVVPEPLRLSPLIRVSRWTFLGLGIVWGMHRFNVNSRKENRIREIKAAERPAKEAARAIEKAKIFAEQERELMAGSSPPAPACP